MKTIKITLLAIFASISLAQAQTVKTYTNVVGDLNSYYIFVQPGVDTTKPVPLLIFLHGMGEKTWYPGGVTTTLPTLGPSKNIINGFIKFPGIYLIPVCQTADWDNVYKYTSDGKVGATVNMPGAYVKDFLDKMLKRYKIDRTRIYITGLSMGGGGTWSVVQNNPSVFAAAVPIAGWGDVNKISGISTCIWPFQGELDSGANINALQNSIIVANPSVADHAATIYAGVGHNAWDLAYSNADLMPWIFSKQLTSVPVIPPVVTPPVVAPVATDTTKLKLYINGVLVTKTTTIEYK